MIARRHGAWLIAAIGAILVAAVFGLRTHHRQRDAVPDGSIPTLSVTVNSAPSQGIWFPTLIQQTGLDRKYGFRLVVRQKPGPVAYAEFASGADPACYCAGTAAAARLVEQGADITLLWNVFATSYVLVTNNPAIRLPTDIIGRRLAADNATGSYALAVVLLKAVGVPMDRVIQVPIAKGAGQAAQLSAHRVDAILLTPVEAALLQRADPGFRTVAIADDGTWRKIGFPGAIPHVSFGVTRDWLRQPGNVDLARRFYRANVDAVAMAKADPERAASIIAAAVDVKPAAIADTLRSQGATINVVPIGRYQVGIRRLTTQLLPAAGMLSRPLSDAELGRLVSDFTP